MGLSKERGLYFQEKWEEMEYRFANIEMKKEIERLHSIIKEVREYIENNTKEGPIKDKRYFYSPEQANDILEILDKENK